MPQVAPAPIAMWATGVPTVPSVQQATAGKIALQAAAWPPLTPPTMGQAESSTASTGGVSEELQVPATAPAPRGGMD